MAAIASTSSNTKTRSKWRKKKSLARSRRRGWATKDLERERCQGARKSNWGKQPAGAIAGPGFVRGFVLIGPLPPPLLPGRDPGDPARTQCTRSSGAAECRVRDRALTVIVLTT